MATGITLPLPVIDALPLGARRLVVLTDEGLFEKVGVRIAFTGREGGVSEGPYASLNCGGHVEDDQDAVVRNRRIVCEAAGAPDVPLVVPEQVHGTDLVWASGAEQAPVADGVLVGEPGVAALLNFADCLPLVIVSPTGKFAVVHAGWRGAVARIASKAACELASADGVPTSACNAYIGPHIRSECFEVGEDVEGLFRAEFGEVAIASPRHVSLAAAVTADLESAGVDPRRVADAAICTRCHPDRYFSHRATGGACGRHAAFAERHRKRGYTAKETRSVLHWRYEMTTKDRFEATDSELCDVCCGAGRSRGDVTLVAVSKTVGPDEVALAIEGGARDFGENRPDQLMEKADRFADARWHFIGNIQSRRIRDIVGRAVLVHSLYQEKHARKIDEVAREKGIVQDVLLEVNVSGEESKSGLAPDEVRSLLAVCDELPNVNVCGLMTMAPQGDLTVARATFKGLRELRDDLRAEHPGLSELSMGMTDDWREAVAEGATIVRIGRAIFSDQF